MLRNSASKLLVLSRFERSSSSPISTFPRRASVIRPFLIRTPKTVSPSNAAISSNSSDRQNVPKLAKENIQSSVEKVKRGPLIKDFFKGKFDVNVLAFPEVLCPDEIANIHYMAEQLLHFFRTRVDSQRIDTNSKIPEDIIDGLKQIGLFSLMASDQYGGVKLSETAMARLMEICGMDPSVGLTVKSHQNVSCHLLEIYGSEDQKRRYLSKLCSGEFVGAVCVAEDASGNDLGSIETKAKLDTSTDNYILDGKKIWVSNGGIADVFVVFAKVTGQSEFGESVDQLAAFIIDKSAEGVTIGPNEDKIGVKGLNICSIEFKNVTVPKSNILWDKEYGLEIANKMLSCSRLVEAMLISGLLKELVDFTVKHCIHREQYGKPLIEYDLVKERIANLSIAAYVVESMVYLTTGLKDSTINPDLILESTAAKLFASEALWQSINSCMEIFGGRGYFKSSNLERILRDAKVFSIIDGTNDVLRQLIAQIGIQNLASDIYDDVEKMRNPSFFPMANLKKALEFHIIQSGKFKLKYDIAGYLHVSLKADADNLEKLMIKFEYIMQGVLIRYGREIMEKQMVLRKLSDVVVSLYAMTACLSRASRSYCIGLRNSDLEMQIASTFCYQQNEVVQKLFSELEQTDFESPDASYKKIAEVVIRDKGYSLTNPINKNW